MSRIKSGNTKPEIVVRSLLHNMGYRFRLHRKDLPGKPDIVLPRYKSVIFVHGCFWHRHKGCKNTTSPKTKKHFWREKFKTNAERDRKAQKELKLMGWRILIIWECELVEVDRVKKLLKESLK
jgi:DNA mismatch endonuclease (patch repair protein)